MRLGLPADVGAHRLELGDVDRHAGRAAHRGNIDDVEDAAGAADHGRHALEIGTARHRACVATSSRAGAVEQLGAPRQRVGLVGGVDGAGIGPVDPGQLLLRVAHPQRQRRLVEQRADGPDLLGHAAMTVGELGEFEPVAGDIAQAQDGAPADGLAVGLDEGAAERADDAAERFAARPERFDLGLERRASRRRRARSGRTSRARRPARHECPAARR